MNNLDYLFEHGIDFKNRRIFLDGEITEDRTNKIVRGLISLTDKSNEIITLIVRSPGGDLYETIAIYDVLQNLKASVRTIALGYCQSAAPLLVAAGTKGMRYATPNCFFMIHDSIVESPETSLDDIKNDVRHFTHLRKRFFKLLESHTSLSYKKWRDIYHKRGDSFFDTELAMKYGLMDEIITKPVWGTT